MVGTPLTKEIRNHLKKETKQYSFEDVWHVLNTFDDQENLKRFALDSLKLSEEKAEKFSKIKLNQGYATLSLSAIKKIIPFLQRNFIYSHAVYLANLYKVLNIDISEKIINDFSEEINNIIQENLEKRQLNNIFNSLIRDELSNEYRYSIETDRDLDSSELLTINNKIINTLGEKTWSELNDEEKNKKQNYASTHFKAFLKKSVLEKRNVFIDQPRLHDQIFSFLKNKYQISEVRKKHLWHPSEQETYAPSIVYKQVSLGQKEIFLPEEKLNLFFQKHPQAEYQARSLRLLGDPEPLSKGLKNPMALKSLHKLKQLLNYLLKAGKIDEDTRIVIEIARELNDANRRKALGQWNKRREKENEKIKETIKEINKECKTNFDENDKALIQRIRLWEEQGRVCLYTGKTINCCEVFDGNKYDIEHTIPASISFDNELKNLTLADAKYNREVKRKRLPTQLPNYDEDAAGYTAIKSRLRTIEEKVKHLEELFTEWKRKKSYASTKDRKDYCIQQMHILRLDLDYWKGKLRTFTLEEYKSNWRNNQLKDTQIITKYALPYLKTVFNKVSVEKASVVAAFKEIYNVKLSDQQKDRSTHSHHAVDASILTLIPPFHERDRILLEYNKAKDKKARSYHSKPIGWPNFEPSKINSIKNHILINNLSENRSLVETYKKVRKRGKIEYIIDKNGNKVSKIAKGDTIRGQLHGESFYGAIKQPLRDENNKIIFDEKGRMKLQEDIHLVIRKELIYKKDANSPGFKSLEEIEKVIVDKDLYKMIKLQTELCSDFKTAINNGYYMLDKAGNQVNKIRHIRCFDILGYNKAVRVHNHAYNSNKEYKQYTLAKNGENALCLFYKNSKEKAIKILSIGEIAGLRLKNDKQYFNEPFYKEIEKGTKNRKVLIPLYAALRVGQKVLFYKNSIEELYDIDTKELSKRMFRITQFEGDGRIKFRNHLAAGIDTDLKKEHKEYPSFNISQNPVFLRLRQKEWNFAIDGVDFMMNMDGTIEFK